jgi:hypothetical protein
MNTADNPNLFDGRFEDTTDACLPHPPAGDLPTATAAPEVAAHRTGGRR